MNTHGNRALSLTSSSQRLRCTQVSCPLALPSVLHCSSLSSALCSQALSSSSQRGGANGGSSARATSTPCGIEVLTGSSQRWVARSSSLCTHVGSHRGLDPHQHRRLRASTTLGKNAPGGFDLRAPNCSRQHMTPRRMAQWLSSAVVCHHRL